MYNNNIKNSEMKNEIKKELEYEKRLCNIYGLCVNDISGGKSHEVSHFGLKRLNVHCI